MCSSVGCIARATLPECLAQGGRACVCCWSACLQVLMRCAYYASWATDKPLAMKSLLSITSQAWAQR